MIDKIQEIPLKELHDFRNHPFQVKDDDELRELAQSIRDNGVLAPALARLRSDGGYELVSGHRRKAACELIGLDTMPVIIRELEDNEAVIIMVDSNKQREHLLPSEKAFAYKMKLDAIKRQGKRNDLTSAQFAPKLATEVIGAENNESKDQVKRFIRLTNLIPQLLQMVDEKDIAFNPAVEISYLSKAEQEMLLEGMHIFQCTPSLSQAIRMKKLKKEGILDMEHICNIMEEAKANQKDKITLMADEIKEYIPGRYKGSKSRMKEYLLQLLMSNNPQSELNHL
ncbi:chromosome partitioning protein, ParB family [Sporobacter termitidis DSM 10068]|uniref:Chromosome partitioning protein, ParB family n=1 Tax=Sporobacter termitidis DSM 10068 TaxID=1123282 RepID=A0A1M5U138_9FIRM|nr:ParB/RepB/Spo0J family partition protein [Sporobacter termitidis]SHH56678.1 chromosome partitioning protein, ParB family [Sporobacter termitidis DSM 10068]